MPVIVWRVDNGQPHLFEYPVDAREASGTGFYTSCRPDSTLQKDFSSSELETIVDLSEKDRLGSSLEDSEREKLEEYRALEEKTSPLEPEVLPAPTPTEVVDTFSPSLATRDELFAWLRENDDPAPSALSTTHLRERVFAKTGMKSGDR